jgi:hypothetical protein
MTKVKPNREIELAPDAWEHFERAVSVVAKSPPQHKTKGTKIDKKKRAPKSR